MAYDGAGNFLRLYNWTQDAANNIDITASRVDAEDSGFAAGLTLAVTRDGQGKMAADFTPASTATYNLGTAGHTWAGLNVNTAVVGPPASGIALAVTGFSAAANYVATFTSPNVAGNRGILVQAGTSSADVCAIFNNGAASSNLMIVYGDGGVTVGAPTGSSQGLGTLNATGLLINGVNVYPGVPVNQQNATYTVVAADNGKTIYKSGGAAHVDTIPTGLPVGFTVTFIVLHGAANLTITNADNANGFFWSPSGANAASRTLAADGVATATKVAVGTWYISGSGLS